MPEKSPSFQFYPDKWLAGTEHLSDAAHRAYHHILCWMWLHSPDQCSMSNTDSGWQLAAAIRDKDKLDQVRNEIMNPDFPLLMPMHGNQHSSTGEALVSRGLQKERSKQQARRKQMQKAANKRWNKEHPDMPKHTEPHSKSDAHLQCSPAPIPSPADQDKEEEKEGDKKEKDSPPSQESSQITSEDHHMTRLLCAWIQKVDGREIRDGSPGFKFRMEKVILPMRREYKDDARIKAVFAYYDTQEKLGPLSIAGDWDFKNNFTRLEARMRNSPEGRNQADCDRVRARTKAKQTRSK